MVYSYIRVSSSRQNPERQIQNIIREVPHSIIIKESFTGRSLNRPEWNKLMKTIKSGDVIWFDEISRMSRNVEEGIQVYQELYNMGVELCFIKEPHLNTSTYKTALENSIALTGTNVDYILKGINKYLMSLATEQIRLGFKCAETEVELLRIRTKEGLRQAKLKGIHLGRKQGDSIETIKSKKSKELILKHSKAFGGSLSVDEILKLCGISRNTYFRYRNQLLSKQVV